MEIYYPNITSLITGHECFILKGLVVGGSPEISPFSKDQCTPHIKIKFCGTKNKVFMCNLLYPVCARTSGCVGVDVDIYFNLMN